MTGGEPGATTYTEAQLADLATLLSNRLATPSVKWLAESVLHREVDKELGNDIGDREASSRKLVALMAAEGKLSEAILHLQNDTQGDLVLMMGLNRIAQGQRLNSENLQAFGNQVEPFISSANFEKVFPQVRRTICAVALAGPGLNRIVGTGFLVAPDLVLTNYHVLEPFLKVQNGAIIENGSGDNIYCLFDYDAPPKPLIPPPSASLRNQVVRAKQSGWLYCARPFLNGDGTDAPGTFTNELDFALIKLDRKVGELPARAGGGLPRGWLSIGQETGPPNPGTRVVLVQHPGEQHQVFDLGQVHSWLLIKRVWYWLNSARGSSGGAAVDTEGRLIALHNASVTTSTVPAAADDRCLNQGVLIDPIAKDVELQKPGSLNALAASAQPFWSLNDDVNNPEPVIGRRAFREFAAEMLNPGGPRVLLVTGPEGSGVRFSSRLLRRVVGTVISVVEFKPAELGQLDPKAFLGVIRNALPMLTMPPPIPDPEPGEDLPRWMTKDLAPWLLNLVAAEQARSKAQFPAWIVINTVVPEGKKLLWAPCLPECIAALVGARDSGQAPFDIPHLRWLFLARTLAGMSLANVARRDEDLAGETGHAAAFAQCMQSAWFALDEQHPIPPPYLNANAASKLAARGTMPERKILSEYVKELIGYLVANRKGQ
jgi:trypsin-like peptidase